MSPISSKLLANSTPLGASFDVDMFASRTDWPLEPNRLSKLIEERRRQDLPFIDLTESNPTRCGLVFNSSEILGALADPRALLYEPDPRGLLSARRAVTGYYAERGIQIDPDHVFLTTSTSEAYSYVFRLIADPGDNILVPRPSYPLLDYLSRLDDVELSPYPLVYDQGWQIDLRAIEACARPRTRAILVIHPNNPTGSFVHREELQFLFRLCRERRWALISDEVFADYAFAPDRARVVSCCSPEVLTFTLSGLSKISALPQMKLAWVIVNGPPLEMKDAKGRLEVIADTYLSVSGPLAHALPALLETRRALQPQILERIRSNSDGFDADCPPDSPVTRLKTEGGWYAVLKLPSTRNDEEWAIEILSRDGVLVHPGHFFEFVSEGHLVVSLLPAPEIFREGIKKILSRVSRPS